MKSGYVEKFSATRQITNNDLTIHIILPFVIFSIIEDRSARPYCCVYLLCGIFSFFCVAFPTWVVPVFLLEYCCLLVRDMKIRHLFLVFFNLGTICRFSWNGTYVSHLRFNNNRRMDTSADDSKFKILPFHVLMLNSALFGAT
jgi:hypothetical protein